MRAAVLLILAALLGPATPAVAADPAVSRSQAAYGHGGVTQAPPATDPTDPPATANPFLPDNENPTECLSSLPRPDCGSEERGGVIQLVTFAILMLGMAFIGWRIALGVRRRDRAMSPDDV